MPVETTAPSLVIRRPCGLFIDVSQRRIEAEELTDRLSRVASVNPESGSTLTNNIQVRLGTEGRGESALFRIFLPTMNTDADLEINKGIIRSLNRPTSPQQALSQVERGSTNLVNRHCSVGISFKASDLLLGEIFEIGEIVSKIEPALLNLLPASRANFEKARTLSSIGFSGNLSRSSEREKLLDEKAAFNLSNLLTRGVFKVNYGSGSTNAHKITMWVLLWQCLLDKVITRGVKPEGPITTGQELVDWIWEDAGNPLYVEAKAFWSERAGSFRPATRPTPSVRRVAEAVQERDNQRNQTSFPLAEDLPEEATNDICDVEGPAPTPPTNRENLMNILSRLHRAPSEESRDSDEAGE